ncbi:MAG: Rhodomycin D methylesterase DauP (plasmid) [Chroococcopsis gigantea SAG 12.99]|jgi:pimeloyl-ACP methyl ester carboxylesterase|nr:Rhodomycin D methylesterase DauP [Chroococcopsis gigantea SAG 12.99]
MTLAPHRTGKISANGIGLYYESFGDPNNPAVLLIMGVSCPCLQWFPYFIDPIVTQGYYVIRFDNRDVGLSTWIEPGDWQKSPYNLEDMALDAVGLLKALNIAEAHIIGVSMGGAIAQRIAISHPERVLTLGSIASFADITALAAGEIPANSLATVPTLEEYLRFWSLLAGTAFPLDVSLYSELYRENVVVRKGYNPDSMVHHLHAAALSPTPELSKIQVPTLVLHGTKDPLIPITHASEYARSIPQAKFIAMEGVGHDIPQAICSLIHPEVFTLFTTI